MRTTDKRGRDKNTSDTTGGWGKNLADEMIMSGIYVTSTSRTITGTYLPPRTYGATVGYKF